MPESGVWFYPMLTDYPCQLVFQRNTAPKPRNGLPNPGSWNHPNWAICPTRLLVSQFLCHTDRDRRGKFVGASGTMNDTTMIIMSESSIPLGHGSTRALISYISNWWCSLKIMQLESWRVMLEDLWCLKNIPAGKLLWAKAAWWGSKAIVFFSEVLTFLGPGHELSPTNPVNVLKAYKQERKLIGCIAKGKEYEGEMAKNTRIQ
ncbi:hypothetical protein HOY80DRAFT_1072540 [Tuber brumale]|nr:hypothetical protein HOY80DRAFT_1072540 [Tuber brumale]